MNNPDSKLEQLLRQWGARRAVSESAVPEASPEFAAPAPSAPTTTEKYPVPPLPAENALAVESEVEMAPLELELDDSEKHILDSSVREPPPEKHDTPEKATAPQPVQTAEDESLLAAIMEQVNEKMSAAAESPAETVEEKPAIQAEQQKPVEETIEPAASPAPESVSEPIAELAAESADEQITSPAAEAAPVSEAESITVPADEEKEVPELIVTRAGEDLDRTQDTPAADISVEPVSTAPIEHVTADLPAQFAPAPAPISLDMSDMPAGDDEKVLPPIPEIPAVITDIATVQLELSQIAVEKREENPQMESAEPALSGLADIVEPVLEEKTPEPAILQPAEQQPEIQKRQEKKPPAPKPSAAKSPPRIPIDRRPVESETYPLRGKKSAINTIVRITATVILAIVLLFAGAIFLPDFAEQIGLKSRSTDTAADKQAHSAEQQKLAEAEQKIQNLNEALTTASNLYLKSQNDLQYAQNKLIDLRREKEKQASDFQTRLSTSGKGGESTQELHAMLKENEKTIDGLRLQMKVLEDNFSKAVSEKTVLADEVRVLEQAKKDKQELGNRLSALTDDLKKKTARLAELEESAKKAQEEIGGLQTDYMLTTRALAKLYISASAPGQSGIQAAQTASKHNKLMARCKELANTPQEASTRLLRDKLDAVLNMLELIPPGDLPAGQKFIKNIDTTGIVPAIDEVLKGRRESPEINAWLMELRIVLVSAGCAG